VSGPTLFFGEGDEELLLRSDKVADGGARDSDKILGIDFELESSDASADVHIVEVFDTGVHVSGESLLHSNGAASASDIAGEWEQLLHGDQVAFFVAGDFGGFFQIHLLGPRYHTDEVARAVALEHQGLKNLLDILSKLQRYMLCTKVLFVDLIGYEIVRDFVLIEQSGGVGFANFFHSLNFWANLQFFFFMLEKSCIFALIK